MSAPLTDQEHALLDKLAECMGEYRRISMTDGVRAVDNANEFALQLHVLQNMVLARAAARAYPGRYRK